MSNPAVFTRPPRAPFADRLTEAIALQWRVIFALVLRETRTRFGHSLVGYSWTIFEPAFNIVLWAVLFHVLNRQPPIGDSMLLFVSTAFFPFMLFRDLSNHLMPAITANRSLLQFPVVHNLDVILARALLEIITCLAVSAFLFGVFGIFGIQCWPAHPLEMLVVLLAIALNGFGFGTINAVISCLLPSWSKVFPWFGRTMYILSGIFFLPSLLPPAGQEFLSYFPTTHAVEWFRQSFYDGYESNMLSTAYVWAWGGATTFIGLALERLLRRRISIKR